MQGVGLACGAFGRAGVGTSTRGAGAGAGDAYGEAPGAAEAAAIRMVARSGAGDPDGSAATRMPQPASSVAAPAAASTLARHPGLTSASSKLVPLSAVVLRIPSPRAGCRLPATDGEETGDDGRRQRRAADAEQ
jgi:hypothetical protein